VTRTANWPTLIIIKDMLALTLTQPNPNAARRDNAKVMTYQAARRDNAKEADSSCC